MSLTPLLPAGPLGSSVLKIDGFLGRKDGKTSSYVPPEGGPTVLLRISLIAWRTIFGSAWKEVGKVNVNIKEWTKQKTDWWTAKRSQWRLSDSFVKLLASSQWCCGQSTGGFKWHTKADVKGIAKTAPRCLGQEEARRLENWERSRDGSSYQGRAGKRGLKLAKFLSSSGSQSLS